MVRGARPRRQARYRQLHCRDRKLYTPGRPRRWQLAPGSHLAERVESTSHGSSSRPRADERKETDTSRDSEGSDDIDGRVWDSSVVSAIPRRPSMSVEGAWRGDWPGRIRAAVHRRGFHSITEFAQSMPRASLIELARSLADAIAPVQVESLLRGEAEATGREIDFAKELLVRRLWQRIPRGWAIGVDFETDLAGGWAAWKQGMDERFASSAWRLWHWMKRRDIPRGWLPLDASDSILEQGFREVQFGRDESEAQG